MAVSAIGGFIAAKAKEPILALDNDESAKISEAAANLLAQFDIPVDNPKAAAALALAMTVGGIYGAKIMAMRLNASMKKD